MKRITRCTTNPGIRRSTPVSGVFRIRVKTEGPSPYHLVVDGTLNPRTASHSYVLKGGMQVIQVLKKNGTAKDH